MNTTTILGAMGVAVAVLVAAGAYLAFFSDSGANCDLPGCVSLEENCSKYRLERQRSADIRDAYVAGVVDIGIVEGTDVREAAALMKTVGTATYMPIAPYRQAAFICVEDGHEDEWVERLKTFEWVEWAHREGVTPIDTIGN